MKERMGERMNQGKKMGKEKRLKDFEGEKAGRESVSKVSSSSQFEPEIFEEEKRKKEPDSPKRNEPPKINTKSCIQQCDGIHVKMIIMIVTDEDSIQVTG